jgi:multidrug resistance efflux pump
MNAVLRTARNGFYLLGTGALVVSLAGAGWSLYSRSGEASAQSPGAAVPPLTEEGLVAVVIGHVDTRTGLHNLHPVMQGRVDKVHVKEGQKVKAGDVLLSLDKEHAQIQLQRAEKAALEAQFILDEARKGGPQQKLKEQQQQEAIEAMRLKVAAAQQRVARAKEVQGAQGDTKGFELAALQAEVDSARAGIRAEELRLQELKLNDPDLKVKRAENGVADKQLQLADAQKALREHDLVAPFAGTVLQLGARVGEALGASPRQPAVLFSPEEPRLVRVELDQESAARVRGGMRARVEDDTKATTTVWAGTIDWISDTYTHRRGPSANPLSVSESRILEAIVVLDPNQPAPRFGQRMRVRLFNAPAR